MTTNILKSIRGKQHFMPGAAIAEKSPKITQVQFAQNARNLYQSAQFGKKINIIFISHALIDIYLPPHFICTLTSNNRLFTYHSWAYLLFLSLGVPYISLYLKSNQLTRSIFSMNSKLPIKGMMLWCQICGHGGHYMEMKQWFKTHDQCPSGCQHKCFNVKNRP